MDQKHVRDSRPDRPHDLKKSPNPLRVEIFDYIIK